MELHILFFILAGLLIAILIGVSLWSSRREKSRIFSNAFSKREPSVSLTQNQLNSEIPESLQASQYHYEQSDHFAESQQEIQKSVETSLNNIKISLPEQQEQPYHQAQAQQTQYQAYSQQQYQTRPTYQANVAPEPRSVLDMPIEELQQQAEQGEVDIYADSRVREQLAQNSLATSTPDAAPAPQNEPVSPAENRMVTLYVVAPQNQVFNGEVTVQTLEALGLQYGEYQIFHRHQLMGNSGSPVIFSVANMMQPGIFDLSRIQQFSTVGLVMFMYLPSVGNDVVNLKLLLKTAENLAQSLGGFVLNEQRQLFDEPSRQAYLSLVQ